jgi:spore coat protein U-like protein
MKQSIRTALRFSLATALGTFGLLDASYADATTYGQSLNVTATVSTSCILTANPLAFGAYDPINTNATTDLPGTATLSVNCTSGGTGTITISQGANAATGSTDTTPLRRMASGTNYLSYSLYRDNGHTQVWGGPTGTGSGFTGTGTASTVTVYGNVTHGQNVPTGSYSDAVTASIAF